MTLRTVGIRFALAVGSLLAASSTHAECITPGEWWLREPTVELVFSGTAVESHEPQTLGIARRSTWIAYGRVPCPGGWISMSGNFKLK